MKVSWNWLNELVPLEKISAQELSDLLTSRGIEVESIRRQDHGFEKVVNVEIVKKEKHPNADRLSVCQVISAKGQTPLQIVCGAQNMKEGDRVALAQVGARLPNGMEIKKSAIRGVESFGMLCSESELGLSEESDGILILDEEAEIGGATSVTLRKDDTVFELGITPNRGDVLSHYGLAREVAAALQKKATLPKVPLLDRNPGKGRQVKSDPKVGPQFFGCSIDGVQIKPSPAWLQARLESLGVRSINNVVDATNFVLFETGQPTHAYDADCLKTKQLSIGIGKKGVKVPLLDDSVVELQGCEPVIFDGEDPVALAGVMGGGPSQVTHKTTRVFLECAEFSPADVRKSAKLHQKHSESSYRFERGIDPQGQLYSISRLAHLILELAGGKIVNSSASLENERKPPFEKGSVLGREILLDPREVSEKTGLAVSFSEIGGILRGLDCECNTEEAIWRVRPAPYRWDLHLPEDLIEEVARTVGYDKIPSTVPSLTSVPSVRGEIPQSEVFELRQRTQRLLASQGFLETIHYSWSSEARLAAYGLESGIRIQNPLSEDQQVMVPSLLPNMIHSLDQNERRRFGGEDLCAGFFELRPVTKLHGAEVAALDEMNSSLREEQQLALLATGAFFEEAYQTENRPFDFRDLRAFVEGLMQRLGAKGARFLPWKESAPSAVLFHPGQSAVMLLGKTEIGCFGLLHPRIEKSMRMKQPLYAMEFDFLGLAKSALSARAKFKAYSDQPTMQRDYSLLLQDGFVSEELTQTALRAGRPFAKVAKIFDTYKGDQVGKGMTSVSVRVIFYQEGVSLKEPQVEEASRLILARWEKEFGAQLRAH